MALALVIKKVKFEIFKLLLDSVVVSIPACHAGDRGSIPRQRDLFYYTYFYIFGWLMNLLAIGLSQGMITSQNQL